jgi:hypothetical protein
MEGQSKEEYIGALRRYVIPKLIPTNLAPIINICTLSSYIDVDVISIFFFFLIDLFHWVQLIYRKSSGFSRGVSKYRGVARYGDFSTCPFSSFNFHETLVHAFTCPLFLKKG